MHRTSCQEARALACRASLYQRIAVVHGENPHFGLGNTNADLSCSIDAVPDRKGIIDDGDVRIGLDLYSDALQLIARRRMVTNVGSSAPTRRRSRCAGRSGSPTPLRRKDLQELDRVLRELTRRLAPGRGNRKRRRDFPYRSESRLQSLRGSVGTVDARRSSFGCVELNCLLIVSELPSPSTSSHPTGRCFLRR